MVLETYTPQIISTSKIDLNSRWLGTTLSFLIGSPRLKYALQSHARFDTSLFRGSFDREDRHGLVKIQSS